MRAARTDRSKPPAELVAGGEVAALLRDGRVLGAVTADERGVPLAGREEELELLRIAGYRDLVFGRLFEGHGNALALIARCGTAAQRAAAARDARDGHLFGVWNTQAADGVRIVGEAEESDARERDRPSAFLAGRKTFCSGAGTVTRALVTAALPTGGSQMLLLPMDRIDVAVDRSFWEPLGMEASDSFAVAFDGVRLGPDAFVGTPGDYERAPWFLAGAARFVAVQAGGVGRLVDELAAFSANRHVASDGVPALRLGESVVAARTALLWVKECAAAWEAYDRAPHAANESALTETVDAARAAVERAALDVLERAERNVGARGLLAPEPFAALVRDLRMYLRQPAPDLAVLRVAGAALERSARH